MGRAVARARRAPAARGLRRPGRRPRRAARARAADIAAWLTPEAVGCDRARPARADRRAGAARRRPPSRAPRRARAASSSTGSSSTSAAATAARPEGRRAPRAVPRARARTPRRERELDRGARGGVRRLALELDTDRAARAREQARLAAELDRLGEHAARLTRHQEDLRGARRPEAAAASSSARRCRPAPARGADGRRARGARTWRASGLEHFDDARVGRVLGFRREREPRSDGEAYRRFEEIFRGPRERVGELVAPYVELLRGPRARCSTSAAAAASCSSALGRAGIEASGVDADAGMAAQARAAGLDVAVGDASRTSSRSRRSRSARSRRSTSSSTCPPTRSCASSSSRASGCGPAGCSCPRRSTRTLRYALKTFWVDPTHQHPIFPEVAVALADIAGFSSGFMWFPRGVRRRRGRPLPGGRLRGGGQV